MLIFIPLLGTLWIAGDFIKWRRKVSAFDRQRLVQD